MASTKVCLILLFTLSLCSASYVNGAGHHHHAAAPAPSVDCSQLILKMADCLSFVQNGSTETKPEGSCCGGLKDVLETAPTCLCEAFKSSAQFGVVLNVTKALTLPSACKIHAPSASNCGLGLPPAGAPESSGAAGPTVSGGANELAPAPSPGASGSRGLVFSAGSLVIGLIVASFSSF